MKALVTGATGFTGGALCRRLVRDGWNVTAFVRNGRDTRQLEDIAVQCIATDISDRTSVAEAFPDVDVVFHIAAAYRSEHADRQEFWRTNVDATRNLLDEAARRRINRFVHCSTVGVQGDIEEPPADETYRVRPHDHYQESKLAGEKLALEYFGRGLPGVVVRPAAIYGPGDTRFLKLFKPIADGYFVMVGPGESLYHLTYIDDLIDGFLLAATRPEAVGEVFTIAGDRYTTLNELVQHIAEALDRRPSKFHVPLAPVMWAAVVCDRLCRALRLSPPLYPRRVEFFRLSRAFSITKAQRLLCYSPRVELADGLRRTAEWYKSKGLLGFGSIASVADFPLACIPLI
jgi:nucleoside-diphosphate-sugar epimerase